MSKKHSFLKFALALMLGLAVVPAAVVAEKQVKTASAEGEPTKTYVYANKPSGWDKICCHNFGVEGKGTEWPGTEMTQIPNTNYYYCELNDPNNTTFIFNNNNSGKQTDSLLVSDGVVVFDLADDGSCSQKQVGSTYSTSNTKFTIIPQSTEVNSYNAKAACLCLSLYEHDTAPSSVFTSATAFDSSTEITKAEVQIPENCNYVQALRVGDVSGTVKKTDVWNYSSSFTDLSNDTFVATGAPYGQDLSGGYSKTTLNSYYFTWGATEDIPMKAIIQNKTSMTDGHNQAKMETESWSSFVREGVYYYYITNINSYLDEIQFKKEDGSSPTQFKTTSGNSGKVYNNANGVEAWVDLSNNIQFNLENGDGTGGQTVLKAVPINGTIPNLTSTPSKSGYTFDGYYTAATGGTQIIKADGTPAIDKNTYTNDTTLYAHYKNDSITFDTKTLGGWVMSQGEKRALVAFGVTYSGPELSDGDKFGIVIYKAVESKIIKEKADIAALKTNEGRFYIHIMDNQVETWYAQAYVTISGETYYSEVMTATGDLGGQEYTFE